MQKKNVKKTQKHPKALQKRHTKSKTKTVRKVARARSHKPTVKQRPNRPKSKKLTRKLTKTNVTHTNVAHPTNNTKHIRKTENTRKRMNVAVPPSDEAKESIDKLLSNARAIEYLKKNVSKMAVEVIGMLTAPKTDEYLAEQLGTKINAIRRILNIMQGYGITNYYISKNTKGWLSFAWYINTSKLQPFLDYIEGMEKEKSIVNDACNDYFVCGACYKTDRFVFTFDSAFENEFKCVNCGKNLNRMNREEAELLINKGVTRA